MSTDVFRRVGRGGAGNFYSKKDIQEVEKASTEDIESQQQQQQHHLSPLDPLTLTRTQTRTAAQTAGYAAPSGRGGAGNFITSPSLPSVNNSATTPDPDSISGMANQSVDSEAANADAEAEVERSKETAAAVAISVAARSRAGGLSGRGGAGNWTGGSGSGSGGKEVEMEREELERRVLRDVEVGLAVPGRVYQGVGGGFKG